MLKTIMDWGRSASNPFRSITDPVVEPISTPGVANITSPEGSFHPTIGETVDTNTPVFSPTIDPLPTPLPIWETPVDVPYLVNLNVI